MYVNTLIISCSLLRLHQIEGYLLRKDLEKVNEELMPLQDDDDVMEDVRLAAKLRRGTKSRRNTEVDTIDDTPKVETFVAGKVAHIQTVAEVRSFNSLRLRRFPVARDPAFKI